MPILAYTPATETATLLSVDFMEIDDMLDDDDLADFATAEYYE
jgi:hypothetical protein